MSQTDAIYRDLKAGKRVTALDALRNYSCFRLAARVLELRNSGHRIKTTQITLPNGKRVAEYSLENSNG